MGEWIPDGRIEELARNIDRLDHQVNGNGQEGIVQKLDRVIGWQSNRDGAEVARAEIEERHHKQNTVRLNVMLVIATVALVLAGFLALKH